MLFNVVGSSLFPPDDFSLNVIVDINVKTDDTSARESKSQILDGVERRFFPDKSSIPF